jgi:hypothetical protein
MSTLRMRMIEAMALAGLVTGTQQIYAQAVRRLAAHYRRSPDLLNGFRQHSRQIRGRFCSGMIAPGRGSEADGMRRMRWDSDFGAA